jgi:fused signal recognition particle receptor
MSFFKKLKSKLFKSSSKLDEGLDAIVADGGVEEELDTAQLSLEREATDAAQAQQQAEEEAARAAAELQRLADEDAARAAAEAERLAQAARLAAEAERHAAQEAQRRAAEDQAARDAETTRLQAEARARAEADAQEAARKAAEDARLAEAAQAEAAQAEVARAEADAAQKRRAAEQQAAENRAAADRAAQEQAARAQEAREQAAREQTARERAAREQAERDRAAAEAARQAEEQRASADRAAAEARAQAEAAQKAAEEAAAQAVAELERAKAGAVAGLDAPDAAALLAQNTPSQAKKPGLFGRLLGRGEKQTVLRRELDDDMLEALEELLIASDMGVDTALRVTANMAEGRFGKKLSTREIKELLASEIATIMEPVATPMPLYPKRPQVVLVVGVNGSGKTTTIGKLASQFRAAGKKVVIAAGDTFRAAAVEQLQVWGERAGVPVLTAPEGSDPASLAFDAMTKAEAEGADLLMIDTAGRLQNRADLMEELAKIVRVIRKKDETAPHNTLLVLDATTGQNALNQVDIFRKISDVSGLVMTKLDGTAKGGVLVALADKFGLPIHAIGVGEQIDDLAPFDPEEFAQALTGIAAE